MTPDDLPPRQRVLVLYLWTGVAPKQAASAMTLSYETVRKMIKLMAAKVPGNGTPLTKLLLWKAACVPTHYFP